MPFFRVGVFDPFSFDIFRSEINPSDALSHGTASITRTNTAIEFGLLEPVWSRTLLLS